MTPLDLNGGMFINPRLTPESAWTGHIPAAGWLVNAVRPRLIVELGTHAGASFFAFCQSVREASLDSKCYAVDTWQGDDHSGHYDEKVYAAVREHAQQHYAGFASLMRMTFDEASGYFADGSIDLLHIDGLHTYEAVLHDFELWLPKMSRCGVMLFHDTMVRERNFGVWKLWAELKSRYPSFEFSHTHGLGVLGVGPEPPAGLEPLFRAGADPESTAQVNALFDHLGRLVVRDQQIGELARRQVHLEGDNGHLRGLVGVKEAELAEQQKLWTGNVQVLELENQRVTDELKSQLGIQEEQTRGLVEKLATTEARSQELRKLLQKGDDKLIALASDLSERDSRIVELETVLAANEQRILNLDETVAARVEQIHKLESALAESKGQLMGMVKSFSWRLTAPLRALSPSSRTSRDARE